MFDIGFWEILLILVLALVIIGPERLPGAARKAGLFVGKARRYIEGVRSEVEQELDVNEFKRMLHNQEVQINELQQKLNTGVSDLEGVTSKLDSDILTDVPSHTFQAEEESHLYETDEDAVKQPDAASVTEMDSETSDSESNAEKVAESNLGSPSGTKL